MQVFVVPVPAILRRVVVCGRAKDGEFGSGSEDVGGVFAPGGEGAVEGVEGPCGGRSGDGEEVSRWCDFQFRFGGRGKLERGVRREGDLGIGDFEARW
jgi:hypothetical protein